MKAIKTMLASFVLALTCTSCLEYNLKELDTFKGADISSTFVYHRYVDTSFTSPLSGANAIKQAALDVSNNINADAGICEITAFIPSNFPASQVGKVSTSLMVVAVQISAAAVIEPLGNAPALGTPADWSTPHKYLVTAASGDTKEWTISVKL